MVQTIKFALFAAIEDEMSFWIEVYTYSKNKLRESIKILLWLVISLSTTFISIGQKKTTKDSVVQSSQIDLVQVKNIFILGNEKTKRFIITRELKFKEGEYLERQELDEILELSKNNVYNTNLFHSVEIQKLQSDSSFIDVLVKVEERWYVWPSPVFRLADRSFNDWWYNRNHDLSRVNYGLKLDIYNFRGQKENLRFVGFTGFEKRLIFQYAIPYIDKDQVHGLTLGGGYLINKKLSYKTEDHLTIFTDTATAELVNREITTGYLIYTYRPSFNDYHDFMIQGFDRDVSDTVVKYNPNYYRDGSNRQRSFLLSYMFRRDFRNNKNYPLTGYRVLAMLEKEGIGIYKDVDIWRLTGSHFHYFDLGNKFFANVSLGVQLSTVNNVPYFNYTQLGLDNYYVRGYELSVIEGPINVLTKNSLKYELFKTQVHLGDAMPLRKFRKIPFAFYPKVIVDAGYVKNYPDYTMGSRLTDKLLYGIGPGLDVVTLYDITLRFEYTYNAEGEANFFLNFLQEF